MRIARARIPRRAAARRGVGSTTSRRGGRARARGRRGGARAIEAFRGRGKRRFRAGGANAPPRRRSVPRAGVVEGGIWRCAWRRWACTKRVGAVRFGALLLCYPRYRAASPHGEDTACARELRAAGRRWVGGRRRGALRRLPSRSGDGGAARRARCAVRRQRVRRQRSTAYVGWSCSYYAGQSTGEGTTDFNYCKTPCTVPGRPSNCCYCKGLPRQLLRLPGATERRGRRAGDASRPRRSSLSRVESIECLPCPTPSEALQRIGRHVLRPRRRTRARRRRWRNDLASPPAWDTSVTTRDVIEPLPQGRRLGYEQGDARRVRLQPRSSGHEQGDDDVHVRKHGT